MTINTVIIGSPYAVAATGAWLRDQLAATMIEVSDSVGRAHTLADTTWSGAAAIAFRDRVSKVRRGITGIAGDATTAAHFFEELAEALRQAQSRMARARETAATAGLTVTNGVIAAPGPPLGCFVDPDLDAEAKHRNQLMHAAYAAARTEARAASKALQDAAYKVCRAWKELQTKGFLTAPEFVGAAAQPLVDNQTTVLSGQADRLRSEASRPCRLDAPMISAPESGIDSWPNPLDSTYQRTSVVHKIEQGAKIVFDAGETAITGTWNASENTAETIWRILF